MKKQVKENLNKMIEEMNKRNENCGCAEYDAEFNRFNRGEYASVVHYEIFYSLDLNVLMKFVQENGLSMFLGKGRIHIQ